MRIGYYLSKTFLQGLFVLFLRGRVFGMRNLPKTGGGLLVANHQSFLDPIFAGLGVPREAFYMARDTLFRSPVFGPMIRYYNAFPVRRGRADIGAIKKSLRILKGGGFLNVFPEGTRTTDGTIAVMQPGVVLLARKARVPLIPTMLLGGFEIWPRHKRFPRPSPVIVAYAVPLSVSEIEALSDDECIRIVRDRIVELMKHYSSHSLFRGRARALRIG